LNFKKGILVLEQGMQIYRQMNEQAGMPHDLTKPVEQY
jgi:hypothetical protein